MDGTAAGPEHASPEAPHPARMYDYYLGGRDHFEADARAAEAVAAAIPSIPAEARANRDFMARATRWLAAERGVRQFLDIGSGLPTEPGLHQVAQAVSPEAKVVYSDRDPFVLRHARAMLRGTAEGSTAYVRADVTDPESILDAPGLSDTIDLGRPVALSLNAVIHFVPDEQHPYDIVRTLLGALPAGSHLVLTHTTADFRGRARRTSTEPRTWGCPPLRPRTRREVARFFDGLELADPGLVLPHRWRPSRETPADLSGADVPSYAGVARKP
ncbi:SAM-dependent methyltransferase [Streptomyces sp. Amel2xB2]|uniref:SAM-dependent methyltransferase n=1 Tax=Streptomyces sp. Amel2xB2 TaxID=1305829 RepID=UPI0021AC25C4|nr:SAM-dependent methyltransferase [Streptomyces sp. Amel2xB2]